MRKPWRSHAVIRYCEMVTCRWFSDCSHAPQSRHNPVFIPSTRGHTAEVDMWFEEPRRRDEASIFVISRRLRQKKVSRLLALNSFWGWGVYSDRNRHSRIAEGLSSEDYVKISIEKQGFHPISFSLYDWKTKLKAEKRPWLIPGDDKKQELGSVLGWGVCHKSLEQLRAESPVPNKWNISLRWFWSEVNWILMVSRKYIPV